MSFFRKRAGERTGLTQPDQSSLGALVVVCMLIQSSTAATQRQYLSFKDSRRKTEQARMFSEIAHLLPAPTSPSPSTLIQPLVPPFDLGRSILYGEMKAVSNLLQRLGTVCPETIVTGIMAMTAHSQYTQNSYFQAPSDMDLFKQAPYVLHNLLTIRDKMVASSTGTLGPINHRLFCNYLLGLVLCGGLSGNLIHTTLAGLSMTLAPEGGWPEFFRTWLVGHRDRYTHFHHYVATHRIPVVTTSNAAEWDKLFGASVAEVPGFESHVFLLQFGIRPSVKAWMAFIEARVTFATMDRVRDMLLAIKDMDRVLTVAGVHAIAGLPPMSPLVHHFLQHVLPDIARGKTAVHRAQPKNTGDAAPVVDFLVDRWIEDHCFGAYKRFCDDNDGNDSGTEWDAMELDSQPPQMTFADLRRELLIRQFFLSLDEGLIF